MRERIALLVEREALVEPLLSYYRLMREWSERMNLIARPRFDETFLSLLEVSLFAYRSLPPGPLSVVAIGAGAGSPSPPRTLPPPAKLLRPETALLLVEPGKRALFLEEAVHRLSLSGVHIEKSAFAPLCKERKSLLADWAVSWGVNRKESLLKEGRKFVKIGFMFITGPNEVEKMKSLPPSFSLKTVPVPHRDALVLAFLNKVPRGTKP